MLHPKMTSPNSNSKQETETLIHSPQPPVFDARKEDITMREVMTISLNLHNTRSPRHCALQMLRDILLLDVTARDGKAFNLKSGTEADVEKNTELRMNSLDILITIFQKCDPLLQQTVAQKLFQCRLAIPFMIGDDLASCLWSMHRIVATWKNHDRNIQESLLTRCHMHTITVSRIGRPMLSKSKTLNSMLGCKQHDPFYNEDSPNGSLPRTLNSIIEIMHFLPSGNDSDAFKYELAFLNIRGDSLKYSKAYLDMLNETSSIAIVFANVKDILKTDNEYDLQNWTSKHGGSIVVLTRESKHDFNSDILERKISSLKSQGWYVELAFSNFRNLSCAKVAQMIRSDIANVFETGRHGASDCLEDFYQWTTLPATLKIRHELDTTWRQGLDLVVNLITMNNIVNIKKDALPLQAELQYIGQLWIKYYAETENQEDNKNKIKNKRRKQLTLCNEKHLDIVMKIIKFLQQNILKEPKSMSFLHAIQSELDNKSHQNLYHMQVNYKELCSSLQSCKISERKNKEKEIEHLEGMMQRASFGLEHVLREIGQLFEVSSGSYQWLPRIAAHLLLYGIPIELLDGDNLYMPLKWLKAVLDSLKSIVFDKRICILSIIGVQSSGKSTLLNALFGTDFAVRAGRCTKGIYAYLLPTDKDNDSQSTLPFDYLLVLDTEGLRPVNVVRPTAQFDNIITTFVLGLSDITLINIKGEITSEMKDIMSVSIHALLRQEQVKKNRSCVFVHQNVSAIDAEEAILYNIRSLERHFDETVQAADVAFEQFTDFIHFDSTSDVFYMPDLWSGRPPMSPVNQAYTEQARNLKKKILSHLVNKGVHFMRLSALFGHIDSLWKSILSDGSMFNMQDGRSVELQLQYQQQVSEHQYNMHTTVWSYIDGYEYDLNDDQETNKAMVNDRFDEIRKVLQTQEDEALKSLQSFVDKSESDGLRKIHSEQKESISTYKSKIEKRATEWQQKCMTNISNIQKLKQSLANKDKFSTKHLEETIKTYNREEKFLYIWHDLCKIHTDNISIKLIRERMEAQLIADFKHKYSDIEFVYMFLQDTTETFENLKDEKFSKDMIQAIIMHKESKGHSKYNPMAKTPEKRKKEAMKCILDGFKKISSYADTFISQHNPKTFFMLCEHFVETIASQIDSEFEDVFRKLPDVERPKYQMRYISHSINCFINQFGQQKLTDDSHANRTERHSEILHVIEGILKSEFKCLGHERHLNPVFHTLHENRFITPGSSLTEIVANQKDLSEDASSYLKETLTHFEDMLTTMCKEKKAFSFGHGSTVVKTMISRLSQFKPKAQSDNSLTWNAIAYYVTCACNYAVLKFRAMDMKWELESGFLAEYFKYKHKAKILFNASVSGR